jgi:hypothetical protein
VSSFVGRYEGPLVTHPVPAGAMPNRGLVCSAADSAGLQPCATPFTFVEGYLVKKEIRDLPNDQ